LQIVADDQVRKAGDKTAYLERDPTGTRDAQRGSTRRCEARRRAAVALGEKRSSAGGKGRAAHREADAHVAGCFRSLGRTRTLDSHASRLRRKLGAAASDTFVLNVWGVGYRLLDG
jgi:hypothetical protein